MHIRCVGHTAWAPEGREGRSQAGPKGRRLEVGARRAHRLLVILYLFIFILIEKIGTRLNNYLASESGSKMILHLTHRENWNRVKNSLVSSSLRKFPLLNIMKQPCIIIHIIYTLIQNEDVTIVIFKRPNIPKASIYEDLLRNLLFQKKKQKEKNII